MLLVLVLWTGTTHGQMRGDFLLTKELVVDPHVREVQINLFRDVEEPRGSPDKENPNLALSLSLSITQTLRPAETLNSSFKQKL